MRLVFAALLLSMPAALLLVVAYVRAQPFGNQPAKLNIVKVSYDPGTKSRMTKSRDHRSDN